VFQCGIRETKAERQPATVLANGCWFARKLVINYDLPCDPICRRVSGTFPDTGWYLQFQDMRSRVAVAVLSSR